MKNFGFDYINRAFLIGDVELTENVKQEDVDTIGYEYYNDYQDKYIYTLKQRLSFKDNNFKVTLVFKGSKIWLVEIRHENDVTSSNEEYKGLYKELYQEIFATRITQETNVEIGLMNLVRIEYK
jgi:hypothetical protein